MMARLHVMMDCGYDNHLTVSHLTLTNAMVTVSLPERSTVWSAAKKSHTAPAYTGNTVCTRRICRNHLEAMPQNQTVGGHFPNWGFPQRTAINIVPYFCLDFSGLLRETVGSDFRLGSGVVQKITSSCQSLMTALSGVGVHLVQRCPFRACSRCYSHENMGGRSKNRNTYQAMKVTQSWRLGVMALWGRLELFPLNQHSEEPHGKIEAVVNHDGIQRRHPP